MIVAIVIIVLASAVIQTLSLYRNISRQKKSLDGAWSDLILSLNKKNKIAARLVNTCKVFMPQEKALFKNVITARTSLHDAESPFEKAKAEMNLDETIKALSLSSENHPNLKAEKSFPKIQKELQESNLEIQAAKRFYNVNVADFNDKFQSFFKGLVAKVFRFRKQEYFDSTNNIKTSSGYRTEIEQYHLEEIERCKRRCELYDYKKNFGTDYIVLMPSLMLTLFVIGVALYTFYSFFISIPLAKNLNNQIAPKVNTTDTQIARPIPASFDSSWKTYSNNVFEIKYPADWEMRLDEDGTLSLIAIETNSSNFSGIDIVIKIGKIANPENMSLEDLLIGTDMLGNNFSMKRNMKGASLEIEEDALGGKDSMHTDQMIADTKIGMHSNYWVINNEVYYLDNILYNIEDQKDIAIAEKIVHTFRFLN